jgi:RNA polymerase sigma factor (sigma-70 family)
MNDSAELLRAWTERGSEDAFAKLVASHVDLVYSVAIRKVAGDSGLAADIAQTVFADLARKARSLRAEGSLAGWLHRHTCYVAATTLRGELRRRAREQTAAAMHALEHTSPPDWSRLAPLLDDAVDALGEADRRAILLRFYEQRDLRNIGAALGVGDDAAQKRVGRALEKLRAWLARRGVKSSAAALATILGTQSVAAAPAGLAAAVTSTALAAAASATTGAGTVALLEIMTHMKAKFAVTAALAVVVAAPLVWQENAIGNVQAANRALASQIEPLEQLRAEQRQLTGLPSADDEAARTERERAELDRLRNEVAALRDQLQSAQTALVAAAKTAATAKARPAELPGYVSLLDTRDVGAATGEAMFQTFIWAMRTGNTNRLLELVDLSGEGARAVAEMMLRDLSKEMVNREFVRDAERKGFRAVRQISLPDGDAALVMEMSDGEFERKKIAPRIRRFGSDWRLVIGKNGPEEINLSEDQMRE